MMGGNMIKVFLVLLVALAFPSTALAGTAMVELADGFDFPVGKPNAEGYYKARGLRLRPPVHFGEDWNGAGGGDTDLDDPIYSIAHGIVTFAYDTGGGWGNVIIIRHAYRDPATGKILYVDSLYGHNRTILVRVGEKVKRGQKIATLGNNRGMYAAHLHFEIRHNIRIGMMRENVARTLDNWADPTTFIQRHRQLKGAWRNQPVPTGTYLVYKGFKGL